MIAVTTPVVESSSFQMPSRKWSIVAWAALAALSVVLSYVITLVLGLTSLGFGLLLIGSMIQDGRLSVFGGLLTAFALVVSGTALWSLIPRKDGFEPSGVLIDLSREKRLAKELQDIASALNEEMPAEVYLVLDANAGVAQRGGVMGFGSRRIMELGLPLLQMLSVSEFRSILAHEFAHFYAGDTQLGPWVFKARSNMARVLTSLSDKSVIISMLTRFAVIALLYWIIVGGLILYWKLFNRLTQFISRKQEFRCDELACYFAGSDAFEQGLRNIHRAGAAFGPYWRNIVRPVVATGHCPQLADGFARYMSAPHVAQAALALVEKRIATGKTDPMDSHPPINQRIEQARALGLPSRNNDNRAMVTLIDDLQSLELRLLRKLEPDLNTSNLKWVHWDSAGSEIYIPMWRRQTLSLQSILGETTAATIPTALCNLSELAGKIADPPGTLLTREGRVERAAEAIGSALALALVDNGWHLHFQPGQFYIEQGEFKLEPIKIVSQLRSGTLSKQSWLDCCEKVGIGNLRLGTVAAA